jgi:hypothetical protein
MIRNPELAQQQAALIGLGLAGQALQGRTAGEQQEKCRDQPSPTNRRSMRQHENPRKTSVNAD